MNYPSKEKMLKDIQEHYNDLWHIIYVPDSTPIDIIRKRWLIMQGKEEK